MPRRAPPELPPRLCFPHVGADAFGPAKLGDKRGAGWGRKADAIELVSFSSQP